ncbi:Fic family protein [Hydrogenophaga sp.]|uniref:Fic family protein n=1 Tax=Hydrogenophaga sp. TaxID=1904254 RepID=UPI00286E6B46|nr:Fic family protein [Hydrogenophaga sp.]
MSRVTPTQELDRLVELIASAPGGVGIEAIEQQLGTPLHRRTLQRRLAVLVAQQRIDMLGERRTARYHRRAAPADRAAEPEHTWRTAPAQDDLPVSAAGAEIRDHVTQPRHLRSPVGYRQSFLEQYHPNHTAYLPPALREQLHAMGRSPAQQTPAGTFAKDILNRLLIDLSWASSHLEGNTYSRLDTERLIEFGQAAEGKDALETQMILNHKQAIEYLVLSPDNARVQTDTLIALHALLSDGLMADPSAVGRVRRRAVEIGGSVYLPLALPQRLEELLGIVVQMAAEITDPFEQAFFLMVHLPYLQPFEDVNKRVSRLAANIPFIRHNLCPLSFIDVPQQAYVNAMLGVYELNRVDLLRDVFVWAYERSCQQYVAVQQTLVPPDIFRLRHRQALAEVVAAIVRQGEAVTEQAVKSKIPASVPVAEHAHFCTLVLSEFASLHAGNAVRFGIRPLEFSAWQRR